MQSVEAHSDQLGAAIQVLRHGGLIVYPTETLYGVGADATDPAALDRLIAAKGREPGKPIAVLVADEEMLALLVSEIPTPARRLMRRFWPGPLTIVLPARAGISDHLTGGSGTIGARVSSGGIAARLVRGLGRPLTSPSANPAGQTPASSIAQARQYFGATIGCYVDGGELGGGSASTVVKVTAEKVEIVRPGAVAADEVMKCIEER